MKEFEPIKLDKETTDGTVRNLDALYQLFPSCFTEAPDALGEVHRAVDWGKLRELLGEYVEDGEPETYDFTWVGKRTAQREAAAPCRKTLRPCPEESVDWDTTQNLYIEGDNLEVLKLLQNSYMGKVKMIYIDPPYNTGNDFVYHDDFAQSAEEYDEHNLDEEGNRFRKNTDSNGRFHSDWCSMIYARLRVARSLLTEDGAILISIDDNESANIQSICNEVFGESNKICTFIWNCSTAGGIRPKHASKTHEYVFAYAKNIDNVPTLWAPLSGDAQKMYNEKDEKGLYRNKEFVFKNSSTNINQKYEITCPDGEIVVPKQGYIYRFVPETFEAAKKDGLVVFKKTPSSSTLMTRDGKSASWNIFIKKYFGDGLGCPSTSLPKDLISMYNKGTQDVQDIFDGQRVFENVKPTTLVKYLLKVFAPDNSITLDFFSGSATTAHAVIQQNSEDKVNRMFIMVQIPEETDTGSEAYKAGYKNICEIGKERIRRAGKKIKEEHPEAKDLDIGFRVLKCDESNYKPVAFAPKDYTQESLDMFLDNIKEERTGLDLLFDCMMRWGLELSLPYETQKVDGCTIYNVDEGSLVACFDGVVTSAVIDAIAETHPLRVVFRDSSFTEAAQKMNLFELFKQKCGWTDQEVQNNVRVI
jgi:adenine-specific DNA-methyltransferase